jgi:phosphate transport system ATP-binding protein
MSDPRSFPTPPVAGTPSDGPDPEPHTQVFVVDETMTEVVHPGDLDAALAVEVHAAPADAELGVGARAASSADEPAVPPVETGADAPTPATDGASTPAEREPSLRRDQPRRGAFLGRAMGTVPGPAPTGLAARVRASAASFLGGSPSPGERVDVTVAPPAVLVPPSRLEARSISAWFGDHLVLQDVSLQMPAGQITALIGPSGCGKSTFLRILNRMHELVPSAALAGEVLLDADDIYDASHRLVDARKKIGMVFQKPNPFPAMSIYDNVVAGLKLAGVSASRSEKDFLVESCLTKAGLWNELKDRLRSPGGGLSGGQQQRLCIARSLAVKPRILLMDEPCSALDPTSTRVIEQTMLELAQEVTIVIVTHNMQQAQRVSQQCAFFLASQGQPGHIVEHGDTDAMFGDPIDPRTHDYVNGRFG